MLTLSFALSFFRMTYDTSRKKSHRHPGRKERHNSCIVDDFGDAFYDIYDDDGFVRILFANPLRYCSPQPHHDGPLVLVLGNHPRPRIIPSRHDID
jgi:hypothetical protein